MLDNLKKNWKTTAAAVALLVASAACLLGRITFDQFMGAFAIITAAGFAAAGDGKTNTQGDR